MSNRKRPSKGFQERTTMSSPLGITIEENGGEKTPLMKHYVGSDHAPTVEEALEMGRALFDSIVTEVAENAREEFAAGAATMAHAEDQIKRMR